MRISHGLLVPLILKLDPNKFVLLPKDVLVLNNEGERVST